MRRPRHGIRLAIPALLLLCGCAANGVRDERGDGLFRHSCRQPSNLALSDRAGDVLLAERFAGRSSWPFVFDGYVFDEVDESLELTYDDQRFHDRHGGGYWRISSGVRSRSRIR